MAGDRDNFSDLREMGAAVDNMSDEPPSDEEIDQTVAEPAEPVAEPEEDHVGGLGTTLDDGEDLDSELEELFGLTPRQAKEQTPPEPNDAQGGHTRAPAEQEPEEPSGRRDERIKELNDELKRIRSLNDDLTKAALQGRLPDQQPGDTSEGELPELDDDVRQYFKPYIDEAVGKELERIKQDLEPIRKSQGERQLAQHIAKYVPGFESVHMADLDRHFDGLPDDEKAFYGESVQGAVLLAKSLAEQGKLKAGRSSGKGGSNPLASRHRADVGSDSTTVSPSLDDESEKARKIENMSASQVQAILDKMEG